MGYWLFLIIVILLIVIFLLLMKLYLLRRSVREILAGLCRYLETETNVLIDISGRDRYMRRLASELNRQLRILRAQRRRLNQGNMELKNAVANISHDLRTPLTAICGYLDLLEKEEITREAQRYLAIIRNRTELLEQLTEELFDYSVILSSGPVPAGLYSEEEAVILNEVLENSIAAFYTALTEAGIAPDIQIPEQKIERTLNRFALSRVFSNLLNNAIKYSDGDLDITLLETGEIIFTNGASSLDEVQVEKLFDRFYTVEEARKSTGLGLSIARTLVEQMHGKIDAGYHAGRLTITICFQ
ncbi:MAG: HAMP domain-containing histidine kinase [Lachnospiraceae bacterium]|nr:HAMP domain-containing histidine kinase [Lachnospiraceae bacterium]